MAIFFKGNLYNLLKLSVTYMFNVRDSYEYKNVLYQSFTCFYHGSNVSWAMVMAPPIQDVTVGG